MRKLIFIFLSLMLLSLVCAEESGGLLKGKQGDCILLPQECASCTFVKLTTVTYPDLTQLSIQTNMAQDSTSYSYNFCNTTDLGTYVYCTLGDIDGTDTSACKDFKITATGVDLSGVQITAYVFFLLVCLGLSYFSIKLFKENRASEDKMTNSELYQVRKQSEFIYYAKLVKRKLWIAGVFGVYLSILLFVAILQQLVFGLGLSDLYSVLYNIFLVMAWGLIPFAIFWLAYLIIFFFKATKDILQYQFGGFKSK